jgi:hypothetical protein
MSTTTKTIIHNGIHIRRSNEMTASDAYIHRTPLQWVVDDIGTSWVFKTANQARAFIDRKIEQESKKTYADFDGSHWMVRPIDGRFAEVAITKEQHQAMKAAAR